MCMKSQERAHSAPSPESEPRDAKESFEYREFEPVEGPTLEALRQRFWTDELEEMHSILKEHNVLLSEDDFSKINIKYAERNLFPYLESYFHPNKPLDLKEKIKLRKWIAKAFDGAENEK